MASLVPAPATTKSDQRATRWLGVLKVAIVFVGCVVAHSLAATIYVAAGSTSRPDDLHTHLHRGKGGSISFFTEEQDRINSVAGPLLLASFATFAILNSIWIRIKAREKQRALQRQIQIDEQNPRNIC